MARPVVETLRRIRAGDRQAADELLPLVYDELRKLARSRLARESPGQTLQTTALVHEAYLRLVGEADVGWDNEGHFFAAAAEAMRRILIERARRYAAVRHGAGQQRVTLDDELPVAVAQRPDQLLALDEALTRLEALDAKMAGVVKLRYFAGLEVDATARVLGLSARTVNRLWTAARAWLAREMAAGATRA
jgi:RNA polymerase sigma factor (TIGR02999 family)